MPMTPGNMVRVLIIDHEEHVLATLNVVLSQSGFLVTVCSSAAQALQHCGAGLPFHCIITDYDMSGMTGVELTRELRKRFPRAIIVGMSGTDRTMEFMSAGANDFLKKPFRPSLVASMARCLSQS